jgi:DNA-directed RNA polymerase specialized sigma subunit
MKRRHAKKNTLKQKVYTLLLKNLTVEEIASALGISDDRVCSIIENILCDISKEIENNNSL